MPARAWRSIGGSTLHAMLVRFWRDEQGAEMVEWAVVSVVLLMMTAIAIFAIKDELIAMYVDAFDAIQKDPPDSYDTT